MYPKSLDVLVVFDDPASARILSCFLSQHSHMAMVSLDGQDALLKAARFAPDVILLDLEMPGTDDCEVARLLVQTQRRKPPFIVATTGCRGEDERMRAVASGVSVYLPKPLDFDVLSRLLGRFYSIVGRAGA